MKPATLLLCSRRDIEPETQETIYGLLRKGWGLIEVSNDALISRSRSVAVTQWLKQYPEDDAFLMVDSDMLFTVEDAEREIELVRKGYGMVAGLYSTRGGNLGQVSSMSLTSRMKPGTVVTLGKSESVEAVYLATGFLAVSRRCVEAVIKHFCVPLSPCVKGFEFYYIFQPVVLPDGEALPEDWSFSWRAQEAGIDRWVDPVPVLGHIGRYAYGPWDMLPDPRKTEEITIREA